MLEFRCLYVFFLIFYFFYDIDGKEVWLRVVYKVKVFISFRNNWGSISSCKWGKKFKCRNIRNGWSLNNG